MFAQVLHRRCRTARSPVTVVAAPPGAVATNLFASQLDRAGRHWLASISKVVTKVLLPSAAAGAQSTLKALDPSTPSGAFVAPSGFAHLRGRRTPIDVYQSGKNPATQARLWQLTEQAGDRYVRLDALGEPIVGLRPRQLRRGPSERSQLRLRWLGVG